VRFPSALTRDHGKIVRWAIFDQRSVIGRENPRSTGIKKEGKILP